MTDKSADKRHKAKHAKAGSATPEWTAAMPNQNIWLAGLGALAQAQADAQAEGHKAFETLVKQGMQMQAQSQEIATKQWTEAAERLGAMTTQVADSTPAWNRLGSIFETRVQGALNSLGLPSAQDWSALSERLDKLEQAVAALQELTNTVPPAKTPSGHKPAAKSQRRGKPGSDAS